MNRRARQEAALVIEPSTSDSPLQSGVCTAALGDGTTKLERWVGMAEKDVV